MPETVTAGGVIGHATEILASRVAEPRRIAVRIWNSLSGDDTMGVVTGFDRSVDAIARNRFLDAVRRVADGEPEEYVLGTTEFRHLKLAVGPEVLIPRPETEGLVELVLRMKSRGSILDLCTGSGCVALSLAFEGKYERVVGVDSSADALGVARSNARSADLAGVEFLEGDLFDPVAGDRFDIVVSNPPYVSPVEADDLPRSVKEFEPLEALLSPDGGMHHTRRIIEQGLRHIAAGGLLAIEVDSRRAVGTASATHAAGWRDVELHRDLFGRNRYLTARWR